MGKTSASKLKSQNKALEKPAELLTFTGLDGIEHKLSLQEKLFCGAYLEMHGNGTDAIYEAGYEVANRKVAASMAYNMLQKPHIVSYVNFLLDEYGYNDDSVDKEHLFLIKQYGDLNAKARGIDMYRKMKGQYAATQIKFSDDNEDLTDDELDAEIARRKEPTKFRKKQEIEAEE